MTLLDGRLSDPQRRARLQINRTTSGKRHNLLLHVVGITLAVCGSGILCAAAVEALYQGHDTVSLMITGTVVGALGAVAWRLTLVPERIALLDVFTTVTTSWLVMALAGALPYVVTGTLERYDDALFESISGFTTTGATVLRPIESASAGILFWRSISQWMGGMGVIVLVVAVLPAVGSGGMELLQAEAPGPTGERLTPRVTETARRLWAVYLLFTAVLVMAYYLAGMNLYDAVCHSFTTVSTGGFSPYNRSLAHFESAAIEWIAVVAMFLAGSSFTLLYRVLRGKVAPLWRSIELRLYVTVVVAAIAAVYFTANTEAEGEEAIRHAAFSVVTVVSTTGYANADFALWGQAAQAMLLILMPLGAMAGSTAGGVKMVRILAIASFAHREALRHLHPRLIRPIRIGDTVLEDRVANKVVGFLVLALAAFGGSGMLISLTGSDLITSFSAAATLFGNVGPGLADVGPTEDFRNLAAPARWVGMGAMLLGRLEIYPILLALVALPLDVPRRLLARLTGPLR